MKGKMHWCIVSLIKCIMALFRLESVCFIVAMFHFALIRSIYLLERKLITMQIAKGRVVPQIVLE